MNSFFLNDPDRALQRKATMMREAHMTRIFRQSENVYNAADSVRLHGYAAIEGAKSSAVPYCDRVLNVLAVHESVEALKSYLNVKKQGYLYFIYDANRLTKEEAELLIEAVDRRSVQ
jgi:hypothetical protein